MTIGKVAAQRRRAASIGDQVDDLLDYIDRSGRERRGGIGGDLVAFGAVNMIATERPSQRLEMKALATAARRARTPLEHVILSYRPGEVPTRREVEEAVLILLAEAGLASHQALWSMHRGILRVDNLHAHVGINRINPATGRPTKIDFFHNAVGRAVARIDHVQGWRSEAGARFEVIANGGGHARETERIIQRGEGGARTGDGCGFNRGHDTSGGRRGAPRDHADHGLADGGTGRVGPPRGLRGHAGGDRRQARPDRGAPRDAGGGRARDPVGPRPGEAASGRSGLPGAAWGSRGSHGLQGDVLPEAAHRRASESQALRSLGADGDLARVRRLVAEVRLRSCHGAMPRGAEVVAREPRANGLSSQAAAFEARRGGASAERIAFEVAAPIIAAAASWGEMHAALAREGIEYAAKGSGAVLLVGGQAVKASRAGRKAGRGKLEQRLGPFEPCLAPVAGRVPMPAPSVSPEAFDEFRAARVRIAAEIAAAKAGREAAGFAAIEGADPELAKVVALLDSKAKRRVRIPAALSDIRRLDAEARPAAAAGDEARSASAEVRRFEATEAGRAAGSRPDELGALAYRRHSEDVLRGSREGPRVNASIIDGRVAQRLRAAGRGLDAVQRIIGSEAPRAAPARRDWQDYAARVARHAFSPESSAYIEADARRSQRWKSVEEAAEAELWRAERRRALAALKKDLDAVWAHRRMREAEMRERHRRRMDQLYGVRWGARRMARAGPVMALLALMVEVAVLRPLIARARDDAEEERRVLREALARATADIELARKTFRMQSHASTAARDRKPGKPSARQAAARKHGRTRDPHGRG